MKPIITLLFIICFKRFTSRNCSTTAQGEWLAWQLYMSRCFSVCFCKGSSLSVTLLATQQLYISKRCSVCLLSFYFVISQQQDWLDKNFAISVLHFGLDLGQVNFVANFQVRILKKYC